MVEIIVVVGVALVALVAIIIGIKILKAAFRAVVIVGVLAVTIGLGSTVGRPYLVSMWDRATSFGADKTKAPVPSSVQNIVKSSNDRKATRAVVQSELELQADLVKPSHDVFSSQPARQRSTRKRTVVRKSSKYRVR